MDKDAKDPYEELYGKIVKIYFKWRGPKRIHLASRLMQVPKGQFLYDMEMRKYRKSSIDKIVMSPGEEDICFIATAVYGNPNAQQVKTLKEFRDDVLMQSSLGRALVSFYYSGAGEKAADFIKNHLPQAIPAIRRGLDSLVEKYSSARK